MKPAIPTWASAVLSALHLQEPDLGPLGGLDDTGWRAALDFCDRQRITLPLGERACQVMPAWVRERIAADRSKNAQRVEQLLEIYRSLTRTLAPLEFVALKGVTQTALTGQRPEGRVQYDIDLYAPRESALAARDRLLGLGYESLVELEDFPTDHLAPLVRKTGWEWRGDYFDPEIPVAVELHYRFWNPQWERLDAVGVHEFWSRRVTCWVDGLELPALDPVDVLGYTALHLLRHLLRGNVTVGQVYELATILDRAAGDEQFWARWHHRHSPQLQRLETLAFELAKVWFGCAAMPVAALSAPAASWFRLFAFSPLEGQFRANKDELWLHWSLLDAPLDRWRVARQRLFPSRLPGPVDAVYLSELTWARRWRKRLRYGVHLAARAWHHGATLPRALSSGVRWWLEA